MKAGTWRLYWDGESRPRGDGRGTRTRRCASRRRPGGIAAAPGSHSPRRMSIHMGGGDEGGFHDDAAGGAPP